MSTTICGLRTEEAGRLADLATDGKDHQHRRTAGLAVLDPSSRRLRVTNRDALAQRINVDDALLRGAA